MVLNVWFATRTKKMKRWCSSKETSKNRGWRWYYISSRDDGDGNRWCWWWWWFLRAEIRREWGVDAHARENMNGEKQMVFSSREEDVMVRIVGALRDGGEVDDFFWQKWEEPCGKNDDRGGWGWWTRQTCLWMREAYLDKMERGQEWLSVG